MFSVCNVAINRPSYQSSLYSDNASVGPHRGNDGRKTDTEWTHCVHSNSDANPWWAVDLGVPLSVEEVFFTNRDSGAREFSLRCDVIRVFYVLVKQVRKTNLYLLGSNVTKFLNIIKLFKLKKTFGNIDFAYFIDYSVHLPRVRPNSKAVNPQVKLYNTVYSLV